MKIHIFGASGSGTSTLAKELAKELKFKHFDTDKYFWKDSTPPFQYKRNRYDRMSLLEKDLNKTDDWILSGSLCGWGDVYIEKFDIVVFLWIPKDVRLTRLKQREKDRYGDLINEGGPMYQTYNDFMKWASMYDDGDIDMRSRKLHELWLKKVFCKTLKIEGDFELIEKIDMVRQCIEK